LYMGVLRTEKHSDNLPSFYVVAAPDVSGAALFSGAPMNAVQLEEVLMQRIARRRIPPAWISTVSVRVFGPRWWRRALRWLRWAVKWLTGY